MDKDKYENYNPDIDITYGPDEPKLTYGDELTEDVGDASRKSPQGTSRTPRKVSASRRPAKKARSRKAAPKASSVDISERIKNFMFDSRTRVAIGLTSLLLGAYLLIAFLSFVASGFNDQSQVRNVAVGHSTDVENLAGEGGARLAEMLINDSFGLASLVIVVWLIGVAFKQFGLLRFKIVNFTIKCVVALVTTSLIIGLLTIGLDSHFLWGGAHGYYINQTIIHFIGWYGAALLCILLVTLFFLICLYDIYRYFMRIHLKRKAERRARLEEEERERERQRKIAELRELEEEQNQKSEVERMNELTDEGMTFVYDDVPESGIAGNDAESEVDAEPIENDIKDNESALHLATESNDVDSDESGKEELQIEGDGEVMTVTVNEISKATEPRPRHVPAAEDYDPRSELYNYEFPDVSLLKESSSHISVDQDEQLANQDLIRRTLANFGINITDICATVGPTVTLYEIRLDSGVRINRVRNLGDDIALSLAAIGVRIIAPIPGKGTVGIEVANKDPQVVSMRTILESKRYHESRYELPIALGSTINNEVYMADLAKMPHLLVAGATGQGKSVGLNAIIASLLFAKHPSELKFVLVDPKRVEFSLYRVLENHYMARLEDEDESVITKPERVVATLCSLCVEMDDRYDLLMAAGVRNIKEYNAKIRKRQLDTDKGHKFLPYIVVIVDEFADLIMTSGKEIETPIARLAQKARAVGIHVILATQRPSANVITGVIKANFPARIAFKVASGIDSKTILDTTGAQQLIGRGDMLISNNSEIERVQCAFIDTPEVEAICNHIAHQPSFLHPFILPEPVLNVDGEGSADGGGVFGDRDHLFEEVARYVVTSNTASTSSLQRRYSIGYNRAGKIMDQLEAAGIVGPSQGGKPRQVLVDPMMLESILGSV